MTDVVGVIAWLSCYKHETPITEYYSTLYAALYTSHSRIMHFIDEILQQTFDLLNNIKGLSMSNYAGIQCYVWIEIQWNAMLSGLCLLHIDASYITTVSVCQPMNSWKMTKLTTSRGLDLALGFHESEDQVESLWQLRSGIWWLYSILLGWHIYISYT